MRFLTPTFLALAGLALPILVLYMLRLRRRPVPVSSTLLWQRLMRDREANAPWQKLRRNLLLLLQLLILAALVVALARPFVPVPSVAAGSVALLLDASASMQANDLPGGETRFEAAQDQARTLIGELAADAVMTIIAVGPTPQVLAPPTGDHALLRDAVGRAQATSAEADWEAALALASASIAGREDASILIISDGGLPADLPALSAEVRYLPVGRYGDNVAISALALRPLGDRPQLFASVTNTGSADASVILSLEVDGVLASAERMDLPAGQTASVTITDLPATTGVVRAAISRPVEGGSPDYLPVDDEAYAVYTPPAGGRVLLVSAGNLFLEQVLAAIPSIEAYKVEPGQMPEDRYDLVILDGWLPEELPDSNLLIINPPQTSSLFVVGEPFTNTRFLRQVDDPILSFVDFRDVAIREAMTVQTAGWARPLVEAEGGPLLLAGNAQGRPVAILTFDLHASDLPLKIAFPVLIANLLEWYSPAQPFELASGLHAGDPVGIRPQAATTGYVVTLPDGSRKAFPLGEETLTFAQTEQLGVYEVELRSGADVTASGSFAVNLFAPGESAITPRETIMVGQAEVDGGPREDIYGQREFWPWLAGLGLLVLAAEWWVYHRGSAITRREKAEREAQPRRRLLYFGRRE
jgi:hypothetical protein